MNRKELAEQMLAYTKAMQPRQRISRGKFWVDATLQVNKSWAAKMIRAEHRRIAKGASK